MRIKEIKYKKRNGLIIYMTEEEKNDESIKKIVQEYKKKYNEISIFISGKKGIEDVLFKMVQEKR